VCFIVETLHPSCIPYSIYSELGLTVERRRFQPLWSAFGAHWGRSRPNLAEIIGVIGVVCVWPLRNVCVSSFDARRTVRRTHDDGITAQAYSWRRKKAATFRSNPARSGDYAYRAVEAIESRRRAACSFQLDPVAVLCVSYSGLLVIERQRSPDESIPQTDCSEPTNVRLAD